MTRKCASRSSTRSWNFYAKNYMYILEFLDQKSTVLLPKDIPYGGIYTQTLKNRFKDVIVESKRIVCELMKHAKEYMQKIEDVKKDTKRKQWDREANLKSSNDSNKLEADAHKDFVSLIPDNIKRTTETCQADWVYYKDDLSKVLPVQTKTATISKKKTYRFNKTNNYPGLLLVCRPMPAIDAGTLIIPGTLVKVAYLNATPKEKTKYGPYFVPDQKLPAFMSGLYDAVAKMSTYKWPSGIEVDISSLKLQDFEEASVPKSHSSKKEYENQKWRKEKFPMLDYVAIDVENTTVDMMINGLRVQDKTANAERRLEVNLKKAGGRKNKKVTYQPYEPTVHQSIYGHVSIALIQKQRTSRNLWSNLFRRYVALNEAQSLTSNKNKILTKNDSKDYTENS
jgi:hypothetical protein